MDRVASIERAAGKPGRTPDFATALRAFARLATCLLALTVWPAGLLAQQPPPKVGADHEARVKAGLQLFRSKVRGILKARCLTCHGGDDIQGDFDLARRQDLLKGGDHGPAVVPGSRDKSLLYALITHQQQPHMPYDEPKLAADEIEAIGRWIDLGAPYDRPLVSEKVQATPWQYRKIDPEDRNWWAFQPLADVKPPSLQDDRWSRTPIDRFILAELRERGLAPAPVASRRQLIRRLYLDMLGIPPTADEVRAFQQDRSPDAYERLVDHVLASPHFGERWARHWLDVARFAESFGFEQDYDRPHAYHYRDFVIRAFNADLPYDRFVRWQIAGDELAPDEPLAWMATGFLGAGVFPTQLTEREFEPARYDELDDMLKTTGNAMLGLTLGCARCHEHKYDPIPQGDYYRMLATFTTAIRSNIELDLNPDQTRQALAEYQQRLERLDAEMARYRQQSLEPAFEKWLRSAAPDEGPSRATWTLLRPDALHSEGGATLKLLQDGSILASGKNAPFDTYRIEVELAAFPVTALRLEALTHNSLPKKGPGRAGNGNFALSDLRVFVTPGGSEVAGGDPTAGASEPQETPDAARRLKFATARATHQQNTSSLSVAASIDGDPKSGWAVDFGGIGKDQAAVFELAEPLLADRPVRMTIELDFRNNTGHNLGRFRLAVTDRARPVPLDGTIGDDAAWQAWQQWKSQSKLTIAQRRALFDWFASRDAKWQQFLDARRQLLEHRPRPQRVKVMVVSEGVKPIPHHADARGFPHFYPQTYYLKRGDTNQKDGVAEPGFLQVLMLAPEGAARWRVTPPPGSKTSYRRAAFARWITDVEYGAGALLARVIVNRLWHHHFGRGIVATPNDFGHQGAPPTHPELLEWLASRLVASGWSLKHIHRLILTSAVYMQDSRIPQRVLAADPENQWLARFDAHRLEAEVIRDSVLAVTGELDDTMYGPGTLDPNMRRRSIYFFIKRSKLIPMMQVFDAPEPLVSVGRRPTTTVASQALMFMNSPQIRGAARTFARRLQAHAGNALEAILREAFLAALAREPAPDELQALVAGFREQEELHAAAGHREPRLQALTDICQVILSLNEFLYVD